ncbi:MAG: type II toxin-antitoxin system RelE/ParE family toxin [Marmoricola sp.]
MTEPAPYAIELARGSGRDLHRLPARISAAIIEFITAPLAENPARLSKPLTSELVAYRVARRGDYRVLVRIDEVERTVLVTHFDHRADVYRPR